MSKLKYNLYLIASIILFIITVILCFVYEDIRVEVVAVALFTPLPYFVGKIIEIRKFTHRLGFTIPKGFNKDSVLRVSFSYLIRIKVEDKYLLVKGKLGKFQPPGGAYYVYDRFIEHRFNFKPDLYHADREDIRGTLKYGELNEFIKWFNSSKNRETSANREFNEELIATGILPDGLFKNPKFEYLTEHYRGIIYSPYTKKEELMRFDIYDLILDSDQLNYLKSLDNNDDYKLMSELEIKNLGIDKDNDVCIVADHAHYINKWGIYDKRL